MKSFAAFILLYLSFNSIELFAQCDLGIIPAPLGCDLCASGDFKLSNETIFDLTNPNDTSSARIFNEYLYKNYGFKLRVEIHSHRKENVIILLNTNNRWKNGEQYMIISTPKHIDIKGNDAGIFYGLQTLLQLLQFKSSLPLLIPCCLINDSARFSWRGMHLDCSRHFFSKEEVERYIDYLARYKFNTFHWHLTDDQGWRIEIKKYPLLTQVGAWRNGTMVGPYKDQKFDSIRYGGYYSQDDIREVVAYAKARFITIVPEIEMPGHCVAALASYPQFSGTNDTIEVARGWGSSDDVYCPKEETFSFLKDVLNEVCDLFPGKYIHIGGDEVSKTQWKNSERCQQLIQKFDLKNEEGLQSYFIRRIDSFLTSKGKQLIGWDEILEGGLSPNATVMSWRGTSGGIAAAKQNHKVVMSPQQPCYFDHYQSLNANEPPAIGGYNPIDAVYNYDPVPAELSADEAKNILGAQANVWTEYIPSFSQVEYMIFPRMCALSEALWTSPDQKSFNDFVKRLLIHFKYFDQQHINYSKALFDIKLTDSPSKNHDGIEVKLSTLLPGATVHYTLDGSEVTSSSAVCNDSIFITNSCTLRIKIFSANGFEGTEQSFSYNVNLATGKKVSLDVQPSVKYSNGGAFRLVDGRTGLLPWRGSDWLGFSGTNLNATIDLEKNTSFNSVTVDVLDDKASWIHLPKSISVFASDDGIHFRLLKTVDSTFIIQSQREVKIDVPLTLARYVNVMAQNAGKIPDGFPGAGHDPWLFVDEIRVE